jgi:hypothetical protein
MKQTKHIDRSRPEDFFGPNRRLSGKELMALPPEVRHRRFEIQAEKAAIYYLTDPDLDFQTNDAIIEY